MPVFSGSLNSFFLKFSLAALFFLTILKVNAQTNTSDLFISITTNVNIANVGDNVVFTVNIKNNGPSIANNTRVTDVLPSGYTLVSALPSKGTFTDPIWFVGSLAVNETASILVTVKTNPFGNYTNTVAIKADEPDINLFDNSAKTTIGVIRAIDDYAYVNESFGGAAIANILANDFLNGSFAVISKLNIEQISTSNPNVNIDVNTGRVLVTNALTVGNYTLVYKITDKNNSALFSTASIFINVNKSNGAVVDAPILAEHDAGQAPEITGGIAVFNVLANDKLLGVPATLANVNLEFISSTDSKVTLDLATGNVLVAPNTPGGPYILNYNITDKADFTKTATTYVTVNVVGLGRLDTKDDLGTVNSLTGGVAVPNVLLNDLNNGAVIQIADVFLSKLFSSNSKIDIDVNTGEVIVLPGLPNGFYTLTYQVVEKADPTNRGAADVIIEITGGVNIIKANEDRGVINGTSGGIAIQNILANDDLKGLTPTLADVFIFQTFSNNSAINLDFNTGQVIVNPGSFNGFYTVTYQIQEKADLSNISLADIIVEIQGGVSLLTAVEDAGTASGVIGGVAVANVLINDDLEGVTPTLSDVNLSQIFSNNPNITLDVNTGQVIVAPGTENGVYTLAYYIEDKSKPESASYADVIVKVTQENINILANPDVGSANGITGGDAVNNVLINDVLAGKTPLITEVNLLQVSSSNPGIKLNLGTGRVRVSPGTPNGIYTLTYSIEDRLNIGDISTAAVNLTVNSGVSVIKANEDRGIVNSASGGIAVANILANDDLNSVVPLRGQVNLLQLFSSDPANVFIDISNGQAIVKPGTPEGFYTVTYQIEDIFNDGITAVANVIIEVSSIVSPIAANDDYGVLSGTNGGIAVTNVLSNDLINGTLAVLNNVELQQVSTNNIGVTLETNTGRVLVANATPPGNYTLVYRITDKLDATKFSEASVFVNVFSLNPIARDDVGTINGLTGGTAVNNVLVNDLFRNNTALLADVLLTTVSSSNSNVTLDSSTGRVNVLANTPAGVYTINYRITDKLNATNFADANVVITVTAPPIAAVNDVGTINGFIGGTAVNNVLINDTFNGATALLANVTSSQITVNPNITINPTTGTVTVLANTSAGFYTINYRITDKLNPTNFADANVVITVTAPPIAAVNDAGTINGFIGGTAVNNVLINDTFNGATALPANVTLSQITVNPNITINPTTGAVTVLANTPAGVYTINYRITDKLNPTNSAEANVVITVTAPPIAAVNDAGTINGFIGGTAVNNVLINDTFNGATALLANVTLSQITVNPNIIINPTTGTVTVLANTPAGVYIINYRITDKLNATNSADANVVITVTTPPIAAVNDVGTINGFIGGTAVNNVLINDTFNGATALLANVTLTQITVNPNITINPTTGAVTVLPNTPAGVYTINYRITDKLNPTNFAETNVVVTVTAPLIAAVNDVGTINGFIGGTAVNNVLINDTFNGATALLANVTLSQITVNPNITINPTTGAVTVLANTPAGVYTINYRITDKLNPTNFAETNVVVTVTAPLIAAVNDVGTINGFIGGTAVNNVLINDTFNGATALLANVTLTQITVNPNITINPTTGAVTVLANTPAGVYTINYRITDKLNPTNFADANVVITVKPQSILATNDIKVVDGKNSIVAIDNITSNDFLNDRLTNLNEVIITNVSSVNPNILVNSLTGSVTVNKAILAGNYVINYTIQDKINPALTSTASVTIIVNPNPIIGLAKVVSAVNKELDGSYSINYTLNVQNYGNTILTAISVSDDLVKAFPLPIGFSIVGNINATGTLIANQNFNGTSNVELLLLASTLSPNQKESLSFTVNVKLNNTTDSLFFNKAKTSANSTGGITSDESTNAREPDTDSNGNPDENTATPIQLVKVGIRIPQGFSPNNDGVHDKFVIENTGGDTISLEIFNRWGNVVYKNGDYKNDWSGKSNQGITIGEDLPDGTYYYIVKVNNKDKYVKYLTIKR